MLAVAHTCIYVKMDVLQHGENVKFLTKCSFLEIYNEQIFDLLDEMSNGMTLNFVIVHSTMLRKAI